MAKGEVIPSLFSLQDETFHAQMRRKVNNVFALTTLVQYEPFVNDTVKLFLEQLDARFADRSGPEGVIDFPRWLQFYAFDLIGELTYSSKHGFLESAKDIDGIIAYLTDYMSYFIVVSVHRTLPEGEGQRGLILFKIGQYPFLDKLFWKNPVLMWLSRHGICDNSFPAVPFARRAMEQKARATAEGKLRDRKEDFMTRFLDAKKLHPDEFTDKQVLAMALSMIFAGSETT